MGGIAEAAGIALTATVFALLIKKDAPGIAFLLTAAAGITILLFAVRGVSEIIEHLTGVLRTANIEEGLFLPVIKTVGIAVVVRVAGAMCIDAGQSSLAAKLEMVGAVAAMATMLPLFTRVLSLIGNMIA